MKIILIITIYLWSFHQNTVAQETYLNMLDSNVVWYYLGIDSEGYSDFYHYRTDGDTIIGENNYYNFYIGHLDTTSGNLMGFIRQDSVGKVFIRFSGTDYIDICGGMTFPVDTDLILMDFAANVGDSIYVPSIDFDYFNYIMGVDTVILAGEHRRKILFGNNEVFTLGWWLEGIGGFDSDFFGAFCPLFEYSSILQCYIVNGEIIYSPTGSCTDGIAEIPKANLGLVVWPNPTGETVHISVSENVKVARIRVYEVTGRVVIERVLNQSPRPPFQRGSRLSVDVSGLVPGMYLVEVETDDGLRQVKRVVIK